MIYYNDSYILFSFETNITLIQLSKSIFVPYGKISGKKKGSKIEGRYRVLEGETQRFKNDEISPVK